jgi:glycosyltransferase involved in cell wall biosynthesis
VKIIFVDFFLNGHHVEYAAHLGRYFVEQGHEVAFLTWQQDDALFMLSDIGLSLHYVASSGRPLPTQTLQMIPQFTRGLRICLEKARREDASIVHLLYLDRAMLLPCWLNTFWFTNRVTVMGTLFWPHHFIDNSHLSHFERFYHLTVRKSLKNLLERRKLGCLFVHTERTKQIILRALGAEDLERRVTVVPDPLPDAIRGPVETASKRACRAQLGLPQERVVLLFFGELRDSKGPDIFMKAIKLGPPEVLAVFAGSPAGGFSIRDWEQEVRSEGVEGRVRLDLGRVPDELVSIYFQAADAVVLPYRRSFLGTSGVLQWAAAAQKPVIATDVGDIGDLVRRNGLGLVVDPEDPQRLAEGIARYVSEREVIEGGIAKCASRYKAFNHWRRTGERVLVAYESAIST